METLRDLQPKQFEQYKAILVKKITQKLKILGEELDSFWSHIKSRDLDFEFGKLFHNFQNPRNNEDYSQGRCSRYQFAHSAQYD
jgi:hypothetical protein